MWYDVNNTLSHNCLINFIVGPRGVGKTYSCKQRVIKNFLKDGSQFVYLRRYDTEIRKSQLSKFFDDIDNYEGHELSVKGQTFMCDDVIMGYALCLSKAGQYKSVPFPKVTIIIFDEFIMDQGMIRYLPNEVETFCEMYSTISRLRDVKVLALSNAITSTNPYFLYFNINIKPGQKISKQNDVLVEMVNDDEYSNIAKQTRFGKILTGRKYAEYAMDNTFLKDNDNFIEKMPAGLKCRVVIKIDNLSFGVYSGRCLECYISDSFDPTCNTTIALTNNEHDETTIMKETPEAKLIWERLKNWYYAGKLRFTSIRVKNVVISKFVNIWR